MQTRLRRCVLTCTLLSLLLPTQAGIATAAATPVPAQVATQRSSLRLAVANVREGGLDRYRPDMSDASDRDAFARRMFKQKGRVPDVVLLQEVLGSATKMARSLNTHPRSERTGARYVVAMRPRLRQMRGSCDGPREGQFSTLRGAGILVNKKTVPKIHGRGNIRTWGRWMPAGRAVIGGSGHGCTEQPWIRLTVKQPGRQARVTRVSNIHVAPTEMKLKNRAVVRVHHRLDALHRKSPSDLRVIGGDFNLTRCQQDLRAPERRSCDVRRGHRSLLDAGYRDAVRDRHLTGPSGVVGVGRRIDFIYTTDRVRASWFDRCYQAYFVHRHKCGPKRSVFPNEAMFNHCQTRSLYHGTASASCPPRLFKRYYSDHPILLATVS